MAKSTSFGQFRQRMAFLGKTVVGNSERAVKRAAIAADNALVNETPFDTGRARGNWFVSIGAPDIRTEDTSDLGPAANAQMALTQGEQTIEGWKIRLGPIFISNSLPYILALDSGSSRQAPAGMSQAGIEAARQELAKARLLRGA